MTVQIGDRVRTPVGVGTVVESNSSEEQLLAHKYGPGVTVRMDGEAPMISLGGAPVRAEGLMRRVYGHDEIDVIPSHDCEDEAVPYISDGALGHGWECGICGKFLQAG